MPRPLIVLAIVALLAACSGDVSVTAPPGSSTSLPVASTLDSAPIATPSTPTSVTSATLNVGSSWLGEGWIAVGEELSPRPQPRTATAAEFGLVAVGCAWPGEGNCPAASWVSEDGVIWTGSVSGDDGLGDVALLEVVAFGSSVFAAGGSCIETQVHADDCGAAIFSSDDGLHWTLAAHNVFPDCTDADIPDCNMFAHRLTTDGNTMVAIVDEPVEGGQNSFPWVSTDGIEWEKAISTDEAPLIIEKVVTTDSGFVGVGTKWSNDGESWWESFAVWDSPDGYTWSEVPGLAASDDEDILLGPAGAWAGGLVAVGEVCDIDWVNCFRVIWASPDGQEWTRTPLQGEAADITTLMFAIFGVEDLLTIAGITEEDTPYLAATKDFTNWDVQNVDVDGSNIYGPVTGLIRHDSLLIAVGERVGILINEQEPN
jgi:hypothetical protein